MEVLQDTFKDTKIGRIPKDWNFDKLSKLINLKHGYQFRTDDFTEVGIPIIKINNITGGELDTQNLSFIDSNRLNQFKGFKLFQGDILMSLTGNIGKVIEIKNLNGIYLQNYRVGKFTSANESVLHKSLVKYILSSKLVMNQLSRFSNQSAQANFGKQDLDKIWFGISNNLDEQQKIVAILSTVDEQISTTDKIIEKSKELKKGLMQKLFSEGIGHTEFKDTKIGRIPKDWEVVKLGNIGTVIDSLHQTPKFSDVGYPMVRVGDINKSKLNLKNCLTVPIDVFKAFTKKHLPTNGDILITRVGSFGKTILVENDSPFCLGQNTAVITGLSNERYVYYMLNSYPILKQIGILTNGSTQPSLSLKEIRNIKVAVGSNTEQQKIAAILSVADTKIEKEQTKKAQLQALKKGLMQQLLTGKKRVKV
jgi:type I restriction enzyme S subunit